ncbi:MAG: efflux transporter outer membrane subunit [Planctomycetaceae bacterium]|nr:efflux transporter outer membrane subunit [Planctomycetaceae bacterium]
MGIKYHYLLAALMLLTGCRHEAAPVRLLPFELNEEFSAGGSASPADRWWQSFDDPNLNAVVEEALTGNFSIAAAWDRLRQARQTAIIAGAAAYPQADFFASGGRSFAWEDEAESHSNSFEIGVGAAYEVDLWGRIDSVRQAAVLDAQAAAENVDAAAISLSAAIAQTWYRLAEAKLQEQLIISQLNANEQMLTIIRLQFRQGQIGAATVFRQEQLVEGTRGQIIAVRQTLAVLQHQLSILAGRQPLRSWVQQQIALPELADLPATGLASELLQRRPDLRAAQKAIEAADYDVAAAIAEQYPRVSLTADLNTAASAVNELFEDWLVNLAANAAGPLFDAGARRANVERSRAILSERINLYRQDVLVALGEVEDALQQELYQRQYLENLRNQLRLALRTYERTRESYLKGQLDYIRVLESLVSTQALERDQLDARRQLIEYRIELYRSLAGGWGLARPAHDENQTLQSNGRDSNDAQRQS